MTTRDDGLATDERDRGAALVLAMVAVLLASLMVLPVLDYATSIGRAGRVVHAKSQRLEAVKGGLRTALADPVALYKTCGYTDPANPGAGLNNPVSLGSLQLGNVTVNTTCYLLDYAYSNAGPSAGRYGLTHTQVGTLTPGTLIPNEKVYPGSGLAPPEAWLADTSLRPQTDKIWLPRLPAHALNRRSVAGYDMPEGFPACKVYFPGTYTDELVITGSTPVYFTSGIYYFEKQVRISGSAQVVVGGGAVEGCTTDQEAAFYAVNAPGTHNISGLGATFVFGQLGRLVVDTATPGSGASIRFNLRYVAPTDTSTAPSAGVSIMTVNGSYDGTTASDLMVPDLLHVPLSLVGTDPPSSAIAQEYRPSTLVATEPDVSPVLLVDLTTTQPLRVEIPGYLAVPQGLVRIAAVEGATANKTIEIQGGVLAANIEFVGPPPPGIKLGLDDPVVQQTFRIVSVAAGLPQVRSVAIVQVNQNGAYAVNTWMVQ